MDIMQKEILADEDMNNRQLRQIIDNSKGQIGFYGWGINNESAFGLRHGDGCPVAYRLDRLNLIKQRDWNGYYIYTPDHVFMIMKAKIGTICANTIVAFEKGKDPSVEMYKIKDSQCPEMVDEMRDFLGPGIKVESPNLKMRIENSVVNNSFSDMKVESRTDKNLKIGLSWNQKVTKTFTWVTPLTDDKTTYFINVKKTQLPLKGFYKFNGKQYDCNDTTADCLGMFDVGRGYHNYGGAFFWAFSMFKLDDGTLITCIFVWN